MHWLKFPHLAGVFLSCITFVLAGPGGHLELVNLSPYDWKLTYNHSYHMEWIPKELILAGSRHEQYVEYWHHHGDNGDCGAEATYSLVGTDHSFTIQARQEDGKKLLIEYGDSLAAMTMTQDKVINLGFDHDGSVLFVMSGNGVEPYVTSQVPKNWMQQTLSTIGNKELREIVMPRSHNAGMHYISRSYLGNSHNSVCQTVPIYDQLSYGSRWFDLRPAITHGTWYVNHGSKMGTGDFAGATGATFIDMIVDINRFTKETPGELIILELSHEFHGIDLTLREGLAPEQWQDLYTVLETLVDLWKPSNQTRTTLPEDLTTLPISTFITPGSKSTILIRIPGWAPLPLSGNPAIIRESRLWWLGPWIQTSDPSILDSELSSQLHTLRPTPKSPLFRLAYTITPRVKHMLDIANKHASIIGESMWAEHKFFQTIWERVNERTWPNLIEVDNVHNGQVAAVSMVINQRWVDGVNWRRNEGEVGGRLLQPLYGNKTISQNSTHIKRGLRGRGR